MAERRTQQLQFHVEPIKNRFFQTGRLNLFLISRPGRADLSRVPFGPLSTHTGALERHFIWCPFVSDSIPLSRKKSSIRYETYYASSSIIAANSMATLFVYMCGQLPNTKSHNQNFWQIIVRALPTVHNYTVGSHLSKRITAFKAKLLSTFYFVTASWTLYNG